MDQRFPTADELDAAGVPGWMPRSPQWGESLSLYYIWSTGNSIAGRLFVKPEADRTSTILRLIQEVETMGEGGERDSPDYPVDVDQLVAMVVFRWRPRGTGFGSLTRPLSELRPLRDMLDYALEDLRRSGGWG